MRPSFNTAISLRSGEGAAQQDRPIRLKVLATNSPTEWALHLGMASGGEREDVEVEVELTYQRAVLDPGAAGEVAETLMRMLGKVVDSSGGKGVPP